MEKFFKRKNNIYQSILFILLFSFIKAKYKEIDLKLKKDETDNDLSLYFETNDACSKWIPSLFSPILIINDTINTKNYSSTMMEISIQNYYSIKTYKNALDMDIFLSDISIFSKIYIAKSRVQWPKYCLFGMDYSEVNADKQNINAIKNLIPKQLEKFIFSFDRWDLNQKDFIYSKLYIGDSHENFLGDIGTCKIVNKTNYYGCTFDYFVFSNETYSLIDENNESYIIYFSSEFNQIYFPNNFKDKIKNCHMEDNFVPEFACEDLKNKDYMPIKLRNDNMNITLEVDRKNRFSDNSSISNGITNIIFHDFDYFIFPLSMLKKFHTQFDVDKKVISFFSNDTTILEIKKDPKKDSVPETKKDDSEGLSIGLIILLVILGILLILAIGYGGFLFYRKRNMSLEKKFNKYSRFEDEDGDHPLVN